LRALTTITSCPNSPSKRLIQGECVPISDPASGHAAEDFLQRVAFADALLLVVSGQP
jgi:hypothetical protein